MTHSGSNSTRSHAVGAGIAYMCIGVFLLVALDVAARWLLERYSLMQLVFLRSTFSAALILAIALSRGQFAQLHTRRFGWHIVRSILMTGSMLAFFHALRFIPLADIIIFAFASPLLVTALSSPVLGEPVGPWRWGAVIVGFVGVLVVLRPGTGSVHPAAIYALFGVACYAGLGLTARKLSDTETTLSLSLYAFGVPWLVAGFMGTASWVSPGAVDWLVFIACGVFGGLGIVFISAAYQRAPVAIIVPFEYTALIWAVAAGFVFWGEIPDIYAWLGAAIITASGLFILYRETLAPPLSDVARPNFPLQEAVGAPPQEPGTSPDD